MGAEENKPPGPMVQAALDAGGAIVVVNNPRDITQTPRLPGKQATIIADGSDGHELGNVISKKPPKVPAKNSIPL